MRGATPYNYVLYFYSLILANIDKVSNLGIYAMTKIVNLLLMN